MSSVDYWLLVGEEEEDIFTVAKKQQLYSAGVSF